MPPLPVETWQTILRYGIGVPDFLDPDAYEGVLSDVLLSDKHSERNNEATYWLAERNRNSFQRVCRSWESYLRLFEHRYVRMLDIWHQTIPLLALKSAIRVSFARQNCNCVRFCRPELYRRTTQRGVQPTLQDRSMFFGETCGTLVETAGPLDKLMIVDARNEKICNEGLLQLASNARQVEVFLGRDYENGGGCQHSAKIISKFPELRHFHGHAHWEPPASTVADVMLGSNLVTLSLINHGRVRPDATTPRWNIPSLRHLRIENPRHREDQSFLEHAVYPLLRSVGSTLYSLCLSNPESEYEFPGEIWEMCPKLEKLSTTMRLVSPPSISHPFNTYIATYWNISRRETNLLHWLHLQKIIVDWAWDGAHRGEHIPQKWRKVCAARNIRIEDQNGLTWKEFLTYHSRVSAHRFRSFFFAIFAIASNFILNVVPYPGSDASSVSILKSKTTLWLGNLRWLPEETY
jgi:hypothetical protein